MQHEHGTSHKHIRENGITILLVDDDQDCRMLIRDAIAHSKVSNEVYEVANGQQASIFCIAGGSGRVRRGRD